jgi:hypothetical protein
MVDDWRVCQWHRSPLFTLVQAAGPADITAKMHLLELPFLSVDTVGVNKTPERFNFCICRRIWRFTN